MIRTLLHWVFACFVGLGLNLKASAADEAALWNTLTMPGHFVMLRHALAPGTGDPLEFRVGDCSTQRNLSEQGRRQAVAIGQRFRDRSLASARVYSSEWCRCLETADLLDLGPVESQPLLNSFFREFERRESQTDNLAAWLAARDSREPTVLVSHQVNITALTGVYPTSGELVFVRLEKNGSFSVVGTIETD